MRFATYLSPTDGAEHVGLVVEDALRGLPDPRLVDLLAPERLADAAERAHRAPFEVLALDDAELRAPIPVPPSIRDFMAFEAHVRTAYQALGREVPPTWYELPVFYFTNPAAVLGPHDDVPVSPGSSAFDYELEVAAVIGTAGSDLHPDEALAHVAGYTVLCDWSARDLQRQEMTLGLGPAKGKDGATSLGPWLLTPDELGDGALAMTATVNGQEWSRGNLGELHWSVAELVAYASRGTRLRPGDVLGTGTVGTGCILELQATHGAQTRPYLAPGDRVRLAVERMGAVDARIVPGAAVHPLR